MIWQCRDSCSSTVGEKLWVGTATISGEISCIAEGAKPKAGFPETSFGDLLGVDAPLFSPVAVNIVNIVNTMNTKERYQWSEERRRSARV